MKKSYIKMSDMYRVFTKDYSHYDLDFSEIARKEMYLAETFGNKVSINNGYYFGKHNMDLTIAMWKEDLDTQQLFIFELYEDPMFPEWFLDKVLKKYIKRKEAYIELFNGRAK